MKRVTKQGNKARKNIGEKLAAMAGLNDKAQAFKVDGKHVIGLVTPVMTAIENAHKNVRQAIIAWKGEHPETLDAAIIELKARMTKWLKSEGRNVNAQSVYNMQSDLIACARAYQRFAGMSKTAAAAFSKNHAEATSYHALVKFCRKVLRGGKAAATPAVDMAKARIQSAWKNHRKEAMQKAKDQLRYAPTESLLSLADFIADLITARKKKGESADNVKRLKRAA